MGLLHLYFNPANHQIRPTSPPPRPQRRGRISTIMRKYDPIRSKMSTSLQIKYVQYTGYDTNSCFLLRLLYFKIYSFDLSEWLILFQLQMSRSIQTRGLKIVKARSPSIGASNCPIFLSRLFRLNVPRISDSRRSPDDHGPELPFLRDKIVYK